MAALPALNHCPDKRPPAKGTATDISMEGVMIRRLMFAFFAAAALAIIGAGCHTAHGAGEDISNAGQTIQQNTPP